MHYQSVAISLSTCPGLVELIENLTSSKFIRTLQSTSLSAIIALMSYCLGSQDLDYHGKDREPSIYINFMCLSVNFTGKKRCFLELFALQ